MTQSPEKGHPEPDCALRSRTRRRYVAQWDEDDEADHRQGGHHHEISGT